MTPYYSNDSIALYHGDCREVTAWLEADVLVTDPPYGAHWESGQFSNARDSLREKVINDHDATTRDNILALWGPRPALVFGTWRVDRPARTTNRLLWHKAANIPGRRAHPWFAADEEIYVIGSGFAGIPEQNVLVTHERRDGAYGEVATVGHPTPKPVSLMGRLIAKCPPGAIADPFAGAGATLIAAQMLKRKAIGVEIDERYCEIAARRLSQDVLDFGGDVA